MKILTLLQARTGSTRLPGKVLLPLLGEPMILRQIERVRRSRHIGTLCLATSSDPSDDVLAAEVARAGVPVYRGSLHDVLDRFYQAAKAYGPQIVVRLTGDCPLADPALIDAVVGKLIDAQADYASNIAPPSYPDGLDVEAFTFAALEHAWQCATLPSEREHVTPYLRNHPQLFGSVNVVNHEDWSAMRWTVDQPEDFRLVQAIYAALYDGNPAFTTGDIIELLAGDAGLQRLNDRFIRNEGYLRALAQERGAE